LKITKGLIGISIGVTSGILWGLNDVFTNIYSAKIDFLDGAITALIFSLLLAFMQDFISSNGIFCYSYLKNKHKMIINAKQLTKNKKVILFLFLSALFAGPFGMVAGIAGISYAGPLYAGTITSCYPLVTLIFAIFFLNENTSKRKFIGIILSVIAVVSISITGSHTGGPDVIIGIIFSICAMLGWGIESIFFSLALKNSIYKHTAWLLAIRQISSSMLYVICFLFMLMFFQESVLKVLSVFFIPQIIVVCILSASFSYLFYYNAIKRIGPSLGTTLNSAFIFWAGFFSILFSITTVTINFVVWGSLLILGIYLATKGTRERNTEYCV